jgi:hypothetical protein
MNKVSIGIIALGIALTGCATIQSEFPNVTAASVLDALGNAIDAGCGAVPTVTSLEAVLASDGLVNPTAAQITMVASQICAVLIPPKPVAGMSEGEFEMATGTPSAPVILGYVNGVPVYGYWTK